VERMMPPEGCDRYRELIGAFVLGKLEGAEYEEMQRHINGCAECWVEARELGPVVAALAYADPERIDEEARPPGDLEESTLAPTPEEIHRGRRFGWLTPAAAAILAFLIGLGGLTTWYLDHDKPMGSRSHSVPSGRSAEDQLSDIAQGPSRFMGPEGRILPERDVKGSYPGGERPGAAPENSEPGRGVSAPPASTSPASAPPASALPASAPAASAPLGKSPDEPPAASAPPTQPPGEPPAASAPSQSSVPPSSTPPQSSVPPADSSAVPPDSSVPPSSAAPASTPPEQQYR
jgi:hypothetical protein